MKLVNAIIRPEKVDDVLAALEASGIQGLTVSSASGFGRQRGHKEFYRGQEYTVNLVPKVRLEILAATEQVPDIVDAIVAHANTGTAGDGKVWITPVEEIVRVRTGERDAAAI